MSGGGESYGVQSSLQNMRFTYGADGSGLFEPIVSPTSSHSPSYQATGGGGSVDGSGVPALHPGSITTVGESVKRRRGRPRKYAPDASAAAGVMSPPQGSNAVVQSGDFSAPAAPAAGSSPSMGKKARGRPPGSGRKQQNAAIGGGVGFTPHVVTVKAGEDVLGKLMTFSQNSRRAVCVLSANGAISNVTLRQPSTSGGTVTYEGRFELLSLSGSFLVSEFDGQRSRTGGLSVSLAGPDGRVLGGGVAGLLVAAAPLQVVVGTFIPEGQKQKKSKPALDSITPSQLVSGPPTASSPPSRGTQSESSGGLGSPLHQNTGPCNNNNNNDQPSIGEFSWR